MFDVTGGAGYQKVVLDIPATYRFPYLKVVIENHSTKTVNGIYYHFGISGHEKVEPIYYARPL